MKFILFLKRSHLPCEGASRIVVERRKLDRGITSKSHESGAKLYPTVARNRHLARKWRGHLHHH